MASEVRGEPRTEGDAMRTVRKFDRWAIEDKIYELDRKREVCEALSSAFTAVCVAGFLLVIAAYTIHSDVMAGISDASLDLCMTLVIVGIVTTVVAGGLSCCLADDARTCERRIQLLDRRLRRIW